MNLITQNDLLLNKLMEFYNKNDYLTKMLNIINGTSTISLRIVDWFVTNYAKKYYTVYTLENITNDFIRVKVYDEYKLKLKAYSKKRFDPFCRWERITIPIDEVTHIQTTIGQLNFFKWALENKIIDFIEKNLQAIEYDMNSRNNNSRSRDNKKDLSNKTRKKREELSISASKSIKREEVEIIVEFN